MAVSGSLSIANQSLSPFLSPPRANFSCRRKFCVRASAASKDDDEGKIMIKKEKDGWKIDFSVEKPGTPLLDTVNYPVHMKNMSAQDLEQLAAELRADIVYTVSKTEGHLSVSLAVVELAVALHHVFTPPKT